MPTKTAYSFLPLSPQKEFWSAMEKRKGLQMENLPKRTRADEIAHSVLDNSVKKHKRAERSHATRRRKWILLALVAAVTLFLLVTIVVVAVSLQGGGAWGDSSSSIEGLMTVPTANPKDGVVYIRYNRSDPETYAHLVSEMDTTWRRYERRGVVRPGIGKTCNSSIEECMPQTADRFDLGTLGMTCTTTNSYGYKLGKPCVLLVLKVPPSWDSQRCLVPPQPERAGTNVTVTTPVPTTTTASPEDINVKCGPVPDSNFTSTTTLHQPRSGFTRAVLRQRGLTGYMDPLVMLHFNDVTHGKEASVVCSVCPGYVNRKGAATDSYSTRITVSIVL